jgi:hypothetical protein
VSTDPGPGAPSFGDLFEDPDSPAPAFEPAPRAAVVEPKRSNAAEPVEPSPVTVTPAQVTEAPLDAAAADESARADRAEHDLDHESDEASHLVAGFEHIEDEPAEQPVPGAVEVAPVVVAAAVPGPASPSPAHPWDGTVDPAISSAPAARVDTGRLYRSAGAEGPATLDAIPAIDPAHSPGRRVEVVNDKPAKVAASGSGLTYSGVVVVVGGVTMLVAFAEALLRHEIGVLTGVALLASSVYAALVVRRADIWAAVVVPPLAFLAAALTAGQLTLDKSGSLLIREGFSIFRTLATNAPWILGTTLVCLVIVLVRRRRA